MKTATLFFAILGIVIIGGVVYKARSQPQPVNSSQETAAASISPTNSPTPMPTESSNPSDQPKLSLSDVKPINTTVHVTLKTSKGDISIDLDGAAAPLAVGNFVYLAQHQFYDGVTFHRVIPDFMIQAGDPLSKDPSMRAQQGSGGPGYVFKNEDNNRKFVRGALGMANAGRDTNGSQFFILTAAAYPSLDGGYTNFGTVTAGMDVADAIVQVPSDERHNPLDPIAITQVVVDGTTY